jgi:hypothetical protein
MARGVIVPVLVLGGCGGGGVSPADAIANLELVVVVPATAPAAGTIFHDITLTNAGPDDATDVRLEHELINGFIQATGGDDQGCRTTGRAVICDMAEFLVGESRRLTVQTVPQNVGAFASLTEVFGDSTDPDPLDNSIISTTEIEGVADLDVLLSSSSPSVPPSGVLRYQVIVFNNGPTEAKDPVVTLQPIEGLMITLVETVEWSCTGTPVQTCTRANLSFTSSIIDIEAVAPPVGPSTGLEVSITSATTDPLPGNNVRTAIATVTP